MDPDEASRKRLLLVDYGKCVICQENNSKQKLVTPTDDGLKTIHDAREVRLKLRNDNFRSATDRLTDVLILHISQPIVCHNGCRASYTSAYKLERLKAADLTFDQNKSTSLASTAEASKIQLRSKAIQMCWSLCIFCQQETKEKVHLIQEKAVSDRILRTAQYDPILRTRLACINDLIAAEGKHHSSCHVRFKRQVDQISQITVNGGDKVLLWLCHELEQSALHAEILELTDVWDRYCTLANEADIIIPSSLISRRCTFKEKLAALLDGVYEIIVLHDQARTEPRTVLVPTRFRHIPISAYARADGVELTIPTYSDKLDNEFLSMVHVALQIRGDMLSHSKPEGIEISENRAIECVPNSLYMFLNILLGGYRLLEDEENSSHDDVNYDSFRQSRILSIAQDLMYTASGDKFHTPKHIGLASTLHQATRSKELVDMFHKAGHVISYRDVISLDTALAEKTLTTVDHNGAVVPTNLVKARFVHFSTDNVDINETTLDGKGTFHATQVAAWQRGPPKRNVLEGIKLCNIGTLHIPDAMNDIIPAPNTGTTFGPYNGVITPDWFTQSTDECPSAKKAHACEMAFLMTRSSHEPMSS